MPTKRELRSMIAELLWKLEPLAFDGGKSPCRYCGTGMTYEINGSWKGKQHLEFCILEKAWQLMMPGRDRVKVESCP